MCVNAVVLGPGCHMASPGTLLSAEAKPRSVRRTSLELGPEHQWFFFLSCPGDCEVENPCFKNTATIVGPGVRPGSEHELSHTWCLLGPAAVSQPQFPHLCDRCASSLTAGLRRLSKPCVREPLTPSTVCPHCLSHVSSGSTVTCTMERHVGVSLPDPSSAT